jgi:CRP/FNR family cyclic AMP-dependent transcriptional regulator
MLMAARMPRAQSLPLIAVHPGQQVVRQGEPGLGPWVVASGALLAMAVSADGRVLALEVIGPGDLVGEPDGCAAEASVRALRPSRLTPVAGCSIAPLVAARARRAAALARDLAWLDVPGRVESRLAELGDRFGRPVPGGVSLTLALTQDDLAALAGTSRESANRALRGLERSGRLSVQGRGRYLLHPQLQAVGR